MLKDDIREISETVLHLSPLPTLSHGDHRRAAGRINALLDMIRSLDSLDIKDVERIHHLIRHLRFIGDPSSAERLAVHAARVLEKEERPADAVFLLNLAGLTCFDQNVSHHAELYFDRGLEIIPAGDPHYQELTILINYSTMLTEMNRFDDAMEIYRKALRMAENADEKRLLRFVHMTPDQVTGLIYNNLGWVYLRESRANDHDRSLLDHAVIHFDMALSGNLLDRTRCMAQGNLAEAYIMRRDPERAESLLESAETECSALGLVTILPELYRRRAQLAAYRGDIDEFVQWSHRTMRTSLMQTNPRQEQRIVEVFLDVLGGLLKTQYNKLAVLEGTGSRVLGLLLSLLRSKDTYTGDDHSKRVSRLSRKLAESFLTGNELCRNERLHTITLGGLLHDIGKLVVPWNLLNKVESLSERDIHQLRGHVTAGVDILDDLGLSELSSIVGEHHERPDGTGYPYGRTKVSTEGAIVGLADAYEAMTANARIYASPKTRLEALSEIKRKAGSQFDPHLVDVLEIHV